MNSGGFVNVVTNNSSNDSKYHATFIHLGSWNLIKIPWCNLLSSIFLFIQHSDLRLLFWACKQHDKTQELLPRARQSAHAVWSYMCVGFFSCESYVKSERVYIIRIGKYHINFILVRWCWTETRKTETESNFKKCDKILKKISAWYILYYWQDSTPLKMTSSVFTIH